MTTVIDNGSGTAPVWRSYIMPALIASGPLAVLSTLYFVFPALAPQLVAAAEIAPADFGYLAGAVSFGSVLFYLVNHAITPVLGPLGTLRLGAVIAAGGLVFVLSGQWPLMIVGGLLVGFGYGTSTPAGSQILADFTPRTVWGTLFSIRQAGVPLGGILAGLLAAAFVPPHGWREALTYCLFGVVGLGSILLSAPYRYNTARPRAPFSITALLTPANIVRPIREVTAIKGMTSLVAAGCGFSVVHGAVTSFFVLYLTKALGFDGRSAALMFVVVQSVAILGRIFFGAVADKIGSPLAVLRFLAPLSALSALMLAAFDANWAPWVQIAAAAVIGMTVGTWNGLYLAEIARNAPPDKVAGITASAAVFGFLTYAITPPAIGALIGLLGWRPAMACVSAAALFAGVVLTLRRHS